LWRSLAIVSGRLPVDTRVVGEVVGHEHWGVRVQLLCLALRGEGVIDVMYVTEERPYQPFTDYPPIGSHVQAVVLPYPPNGQLRLSTRRGDVDPVPEKPSD
jgi:hypothetical protein